MTTDALGLTINRPNDGVFSGDGLSVQTGPTEADSTSGLSLGCYIDLWDVTTEQVLLANVEAGVDTALTVLAGEVTLSQDASAWVASVAADTETSVVATDDGHVYTGTQSTFAASTTAGTAATIAGTQGIAIGGYSDETDQCTGDIDDPFTYEGILTEAEARAWCHYTLTQHGITPAWAAVA